MNSEKTNKEQTISELKLELARANERGDYYEKKYNELLNSSSWKITKPIRKLFDVVKNKSVFIDNTVSYMDSFFEFRETKRIGILATKHTRYVAELIRKALLRYGFMATIEYDEKKKYKNIPYIVVCPQMFTVLPKFYIAFQMEQTVNSRWLTEKYINTLKNAYAVFDYSLENISYFNKAIPNSTKLFYYLPIAFDKTLKTGDSNRSEYDVLFYGDINNERRKHYIEEISRKFNVKILSEVFDEDLYRNLRKAKVIINIHYYENALLETTRIYEALSVSNSIIVSEKSSDQIEEQRLEGFVDFVETDDVEAMINRIEYWLIHDNEREKEIIRRNQLLLSCPNAFEFYFDRFLLANELISFDDFYHNNRNYIDVNSGKLCLGLPEYSDRIKHFSQKNKYGFTIIPGLRHKNAWIGCALSYKFMFSRLCESNLEKCIICEDDVAFPENFEKRLSLINEVLDNKNNWDVFSGFMADVGQINIKNVFRIERETFIEMDKMISMVFNIYTRSAFEIIASWDDSNHDVEDNTIDRYLENKDMNVITTVPFLVGHDEKENSTIWNFKNTEYNDLINKSSVKLKEKVDSYYASLKL